MCHSCYFSSRQCHACYSFSCKLLAAIKICLNILKCLVTSVFLFFLVYSLRRHKIYPIFSFLIFYLTFFVKKQNLRTLYLNLVPPILYFTKRKLLRNYGKCFLFLNCSFHCQHGWIFVIFFFFVHLV